MLTTEDAEACVEYMLNTQVCYKIIGGYFKTPGASFKHAIIQAWVRAKEDWRKNFLHKEPEPAWVKAGLGDLTLGLPPVITLNRESFL